MLKKFAILFLLCALGLATLSLTACGNTFEGAGRDMENWGKTMQKTF